jgi:hypothetical protein
MPGMGAAIQIGISHAAFANHEDPDRPLASTDAEFARAGIGQI